MWSPFRLAQIKWPSRHHSVHKGQCGRILVIAGSENMIGAALMAAKTAIKSGAGMVYLLTVSSAIPNLAIQVPELMVYSYQTDTRVLNTAEFSNILESFQIDAAVIGPGLQLDMTSPIRRWIKCLNKAGIKTVIDATAINAVDIPFLTRLNSDQFVLTPHHGELKRLLAAEVVTDPETVLELLVEQTGQVFVLKGPGTIVASRRNYYLNQSGNSGLATAGTGDVLAGLIAGLLGQSRSVYDAAVMGTYAHGLAADYCFDAVAEFYSATDVHDQIPIALKKAIYG